VSATGGRRVKYQAETHLTQTEMNFAEEEKTEDSILKYFYNFDNKSNAL